MFIDVVFFGLALFFVCWVRESTLPFQVTWHNFFLTTVNPYRPVFFFWALVTVFLNNSYGLYQTKREIFETIEIWQVVKSTLLSALIVIVAIYLLKIEDFPRSILLMVTIFLAAFFSIWRIFKRFFVDYLVRQGYNNFNALIIGAGRVGTALADEIKKKPGLGIKVVGYLDDFKDTPLENNSLSVLGKINDFSSIVRREFIDKVFITTHHDSRVFLKLLGQAKKLGIAVRVVPQGFELMPGEFCKYNIGFIPILEYCDAAPFRVQIGKRIFDFIAASILMVVLFPVFLLLMISIKLDSSGPIFYLSHRYGRGGKKFNMLKFRSMVRDADEALKKMQDKNEVDGPIFKMKKDPRVTKIGKFLRKYSLDELPQIMNVMAGNMSLVGPRPLPLHQVEREDFKQLKRLEVRPGITGLWQIRGRSDISFKRLVKWDTWYINNWSFWLDVNILWQTIPVVFKGSGAY